MRALETAALNMEESYFFGQMCTQGDCLHLRPQQRVPLPPPNKVIVLREGMLAVDAMPVKDKLQVLDFLVPGDVVTASTVLPTPSVSLRALTSASLVALEPPELCRAPPADEYWTFLIARCLNQLARVNIHQLMIGRLETEPRVASFILALALRSRQEDISGITVALPMSRDDIANYLVINCDTLSRVMMKFCDYGLIKKESRHLIQVTNLAELKRKSPMASLLTTFFAPAIDKSECTSRRSPEVNVPARPHDQERAAILQRRISVH